MKKKALLVGINDYPGNSKLQGCVNDCLLMYKVLKNKYGFTDIKLITDTECDKQNIVKHLE
mgnify:CR=1 FL=1